RDPYYPVPSPPDGLCMSQALSHVLALAGSLCAAPSLVAGEALRPGDEPSWRRLTPRMLLSLLLLGFAVLVGALELVAPPAGAASGSWPGLVLLALGTGATLWAYHGGPRRRGMV